MAKDSMLIPSSPAREGVGVDRLPMDLSLLGSEPSLPLFLRSLQKVLRILLLIQREVPACKGGGVSKVPRLPVDCDG